MLFSSRPPVMPTPTETLPGRTTPLATAAEHFVLHRPLKPPYPMGFEQVYFALGCFWGAERAFWTRGDGHFPNLRNRIGGGVGFVNDHVYEPAFAFKPEGAIAMIIFEPSLVAELDR